MLSLYPLHSLDEEESSDSDEDEEDGESVVGVMPPVASVEDDSDAHLSDLDDDIKEYIATKKEVHIQCSDCSSWAP